MLKGLLISTSALAMLTIGAQAADLYVPPAAAPAVAPVTSSWDGAYIGASIGYGPGSFSYDDCEGGSDNGCSIDFSGFFAGGQIGYNFQLSDSIVAGLEGDINWTNEKGSSYDPESGFPDYPYADYTDNFHLTWTGAITGHLGLALDNFMPYVLAGIAFAGGHDSDEYTYDGETLDSTSGDSTHVGYTVGAGLAAKIADNLSAFVEARYSDYGKASYDHDIGDAHIHDTTVKVGLNYHF